MSILQMGLQYQFKTFPRPERQMPLGLVAKRMGMEPLNWKSRMRVSSHILVHCLVNLKLAESLIR
ncbi:MAG: hypothetical protein NXH87_11005 [Rhodobiaceae bacterium]|nr:hypothetical protein [Rhodobiaceae bacterium]